MNLFLFCVMFFVKKGSFPAKTANVLKHMENENLKSNTLVNITNAQ